jgi:hypothetical protein
MTMTFDPLFNSTRLFLVGFVKNKVHFPPLPTNIGLGARVAGAVAEVTTNMLVAPGEKLIIDGVFVVLHLESHRIVTFIHQTKLEVFGYIYIYLGFIYHLLINAYIISNLLSYF